MLATYNPEEGDVRQHLLDRFALIVQTDNQLGTEERVQAACQVRYPALCRSFASSASWCTLAALAANLSAAIAVRALQLEEFERDRPAYMQARKDELEDVMLQVGVSEPGCFTHQWELEACQEASLHWHGVNVRLHRIVFRGGGGGG